jgi:hypothetical protein
MSLSFQSCFNVTTVALSVAFTARLEVRHLGLLETIELERQAQHRRSGKVNYQGRHATPSKILKRMLFLFQRFCASDKRDHSVGRARDFVQLFSRVRFIICFQGEKRGVLLEVGGILTHSFLWQHITAEENCA